MKTYTDLSYCPEWEHYHYDKEEYKKLLEEIAGKENNSLMRCEHTLKVANTIESLWYAILGLLGFEDRTNVIKVNYELLKILRYGESHHFFEDVEIRKTLTVVQKNLVKDYQHRRIGQIVERLLSVDNSNETPAAIINNRISLYYRENQKHLCEAFWPRIFHSYVTPMYREAALVHFNMGRIFLSEQNCEKAIISFQNALEIDPEYPDCLIHLSKALLAQGEQLLSQQQWNEALRIYDKAALSLRMFDTKKLNPAEISDINDLLTKICLYTFAIEVKLDRFAEGVSTLRKLANNNVETFEQKLNEYQNLVTPLSPLFPTDFQQAKLFIRFAQELPAFQKALPYLKKAIEALTRLIKSDKDPEIYQQLLQAHIMVAKEFAFTKQCESAESHLNSAYGVFLESQNILSQEVNSYYYSEFIKGYEYLANVHGTEKNNLEAFRIYQRLKDMFFHDFALKAKCCSEIAKLLSQEGKHEEAWKELEVAQMVDPKIEHTEQFKDLAIKIAQEAANQRHYTKSKIYWKKVLSLDPENYLACRGLALAYFELENDEKADSFLKKALSLNSNDAEIVFLKGIMDDEKGNFAKAFENYSLACKLDQNNPNYQQKLLAASIKAGDRIYARGSCRPEHIQQALLDFIEFVNSSPFGKKIELALGAWKGPSSKQNEEFKSLGKTIESPDDVEKQAKRALELIETAYDGHSHHLPPSELPSELDERMRILSQQISQMIDYYSAFNQATLDFVHEVLKAKYYEEIESSLGKWRGPSSSHNREFCSLGQNISELSQIEKEFKRAIELVEKAYDGQKPHLLPQQMPQALREKLEKMRSLLTPTTSAHEAIPHYLKAYELSPNKYHSYLNNLIDSYYRINDCKQAIAWYEKLTQQFANYPIWINPEAYLKIAENLLAANKSSEALTLINKAIEIAPARPASRQALSHAYFTIGEKFLKKQNNSIKALEYYQKALNCGVEAEGACYAALADYYEKQVEFATNLTMKNSLIEQITEYRKKAAVLDPQNAAFQYEYGRILYHEDLSKTTDPVPYLERAVELNPDNVTYLYGLIMAMRRRGDDDTQMDDYMSQFKALGGNFANDYWEPLH